MSDADALERIAVAVAVEGAALVRAAHGDARAAGVKSSPTDVVTATDLAAERLIRTRLAERLPESGVIGEEGAATAPGAHVQWIVDPLDGTVNFLYALPVYAVSIAAAVAGDVVAGAVVDVLGGEVFSAARGSGARVDGRRIAVSGCGDLNAALIATGFSYQDRLRRLQGEIVGRLLPLARDVRCFGSAALQLCWVAAGRLDGYFERDIKPWDYAAGELIAREAGAATELPCPENHDLVLASTPALFERLWAIVDVAQPEPVRT